MKKNIFSILIGLFISCEVVVEVKTPDFKPSLVLNCFFNPDSTISIKLTSNQYVLNRQDDYPNIEGATIILYEEGSKVAELEADTIPGVYRADFVPKEGLEYRITVEKEGFKTISAKSTIPAEKPTFTTGKLEPYGEANYTQDYRLIYTLTDHPGQDYFETLLYLKTVFQDYYWDGDTAYWHKIGEGLESVYYSIEEGHVDDFTSSNFGGVFSDEDFGGTQQDITIEFDDYPNHRYSSVDSAHVNEFYFQVRHLSREYYEYKRTSQLQQDNQDDIFAEPVSVFNNIQNGFGIFAGYNSETVQFQHKHVVKGDFLE